MNLLAAALLLLASGETYTSYPAFGDREPDHYQDARVQMVTDKGIVRELVVQCQDRSEGIMTHDTVADAFCDSRNVCHGSLDKAIRTTCSASE